MNNFEEYFNFYREILKNRMINVSNDSPFYKRLFRRTIDRFKKDTHFDYAFYKDIPFTNKDDLKRNYPYGFISCEKQKLAAFFESSGTTDGSIKSSRTGSFRSDHDLDRDIARRTFNWISDLEKGDVAVIFLPYSMTTSGITYHGAFKKFGMIPVAMDQGNTICSYSRVYDIAENLKAKVLVCSNPLLLNDIIQFSDGVNIFELEDLKYVIAAGVPFSRKYVEWFKGKYDIQLLRSYGMSEFGSIGVPCKNGNVHVHPDFFVEIVNPKNDEKSIYKNELGGELIITDLYSEASPLIKYKTSDAGRLFFNKCSCDIKTPVIEVFGRVKDTITYRDELIFPTSFQEILFDIPGISPVHKVVVKGEEEIHIELYIQQMTNAKLDIDEIKSKIGRHTAVPIEIKVVKWGMLFEGLYSQEIYKSTQTTKNMSFHDDRAGKWTITY